MIDRPLKEKIAKLYSAATKISIVLAVISIILSVAMQTLHSALGKADYYLSYTAVLILAATPFIGITLAVFHYITEKNRKMLLFSVLIMIILVAGIFFKI